MIPESGGHLVEWPLGGHLTMTWIDTSAGKQTQTDSTEFQLHVKLTRTSGFLLNG